MGDDRQTIAAVESAGAKHIQASYGEIVVDKKYKVVTSPCYMLNATIDQIGESADRVVREMMKLSESV